MSTSATTTTATTTSVTSHHLLLDKYNGHQNVVRAENWVALFECATYNVVDEKSKIYQLMRHLSEDALNWFATDIAPKITHITWSETKSQFLARFGQPIVHPLVEAQKRILTRADTVQGYYNDKMRLIR